MFLTADLKITGLLQKLKIPNFFNNFSAQTRPTHFNSSKPLFLTHIFYSDIKKKIFSINTQHLTSIITDIAVKSSHQVTTLYPLMPAVNSRVAHNIYKQTDVWDLSKVN